MRSEISAMARVLAAQIEAVSRLFRYDASTDNQRFGNI